jgi:hypothetical protein
MSPSDLVTLLQGAVERLRHDGALYRFTFGWSVPIAAAVLDRLGLTAVRMSATLGNLPPAVVCRIRRRSVANISEGNVFDSRIACWRGVDTNAMSCAAETMGGRMYT